jgi:hypothetical protein
MAISSCFPDRQTSICLLQMNICFPWLANDKWLSMIAVSANVPIYGSQVKGAYDFQVNKQERGRLLITQWSYCN